MIRAVLILIVSLSSTVIFSVIYAEEKPQEQPAAKRLVIVTSFPQKMTAIYKQEFERKNAGVEVEILKKKTSAGLKYLQSVKEKNSVDLFWVSAPDAFEVLKKKGMLQQYRPQAKGIPRRISGYPVNDPDGYYSGFAAAGYGFMWNTEYLRSHNLPEPKQWIDLARPEYAGHIGLSAPSRSGTTHLTVEAILQLRGWRPGWSLVKGIAANAKTITQKSSQVPKGVVAGDFGVGIVIDYYGLTAKANGAPVEFAYPDETVFVPSSIALLNHAPQAELARRFIEFILSREGQRLLLSNDIGRLPIWPEAYLQRANGEVPAFFPRPFSARQLGSHTMFDVQKSRLRYNLINSLFDVMITYRLEDLRAASQVIQATERKLLLSSTARPVIAAAITRSLDLVNRVPINELSSNDPKFASKFKQKRKTREDMIDGEQGEIERRWDAEVGGNYRQAMSIISQRE